MTSSSPFRLALLVPFLFAAGCYVNVHDSDGSGDGYRPPPPTFYCQDNSECLAGEYCFRSECRRVPEGATACSMSSECDHREQCINGFCTERCAKDTDCTASNAICQQNYCVTPPSGGGASDGGTSAGPCTTHASCGVGAYCINTVCYLGCQANTDCPSAESCQAGVCRPRPSTQQPACTSGAQCGTGEDCVDGLCRAQCTSSTGCATGQVCSIGYCSPAPTQTGSGQACAATCECPSGETCVGGTCQL